MHQPRPLWWSPILLLLLLLLLACNVTLLTQPPAPTLRVSVSTPTPIRTAQPTPTLTLPWYSATSAADAPIPVLLDEVQSDSLMLRVFDLAGFYTRHVLSAAQPTQGIDAARDWLIAQFNAIQRRHPKQPIQVWTQPVQYAWNGHAITCDNVVAVFPGSEVGAGVIVVGAHYDSITRDWQNGTAHAPGANDNGSGVAAMLEIAGIMAKRPHRATIMFVGFAGEETGKQGSAAFVRDYLQANNVDLRAMLNLDLIGSWQGVNGEINPTFVRLFSAEPNQSISRQLARQFALVSKTYVQEADLLLQSAEERQGRWGDHQSFSAAGYAAVRLIQGLEDPAIQHSAADLPDLVEPAYLMLTTRLALATVYVLSAGPPAPPQLAFQSRGGDQQTLALTWGAVAGSSGYVIALRKSSSLYFDRILTLAKTERLAWSGLLNYDYIAIATLDGQGVMGPLSAEYAINDLLRRS